MPSMLVCIKEVCVCVCVHHTVSHSVTHAHMHTIMELMTVGLCVHSHLLLCRWTENCKTTLLCHYQRNSQSQGGICGIQYHMLTTGVAWILPCLKYLSPSKCRVLANWAHISLLCFEEDTMERTKRDYTGISID